jgi:hypothetical protein
MSSVSGTLFPRGVPGVVMLFSKSSTSGPGRRGAVAFGHGGEFLSTPIGPWRCPGSPGWRARDARGDGRCRASLRRRHLAFEAVAAVPAGRWGWRIAAGRAQVLRGFAGLRLGPTRVRARMAEAIAHACSCGRGAGWVWPSIVRMRVRWQGGGGNLRRFRRSVESGDALVKCGAAAREVLYRRWHTNEMMHMSKAIIRAHSAECPRLIACTSARTMSQSVADSRGACSHAQCCNFYFACRLLTRGGVAWFTASVGRWPVGSFHWTSGTSTTLSPAAAPAATVSPKGTESGRAGGGRRILHPARPCAMVGGRRRGPSRNAPPIVREQPMQFIVWKDEHSVGEPRMDAHTRRSSPPSTRSTRAAPGREEEKVVLEALDRLEELHERRTTSGPRSSSWSGPDMPPVPQPARGGPHRPPTSGATR